MSERKATPEAKKNISIGLTLAWARRKAEKLAAEETK